MEARDDAEKTGPRSTCRPEIILILILAGRDQLSFGGNHLDGFNAFAAVAPGPLIPRHAAAQQITAQFHLGTMPAGKSHPQRVQSPLRVPIADNRLYQCLAINRIDREDLVKLSQINQDAAVSQGRLAPIVSRRAPRLSIYWLGQRVRRQ